MREKKMSESIEKSINEWKLEIFLLLPILYCFFVAINDRDFAQMGATVGFVAFAWLFTILRIAVKNKSQ